jgi:PAS domain S-box-containing protein
MSPKPPFQFEVNSTRIWWLVIASFIVFSGVGGFWLSSSHRANQAVAIEQFNKSFDLVIGQILERVRLYEYGVRSVRGAVVARGLQDLDRASYLDYVSTRDFSVEFPGARGFGVIYRVAEPDAPSFEYAMSAENQREVKIRQLSPHNGERYVIRYVEPYDKNSEAVGLDIASEASRKEAAQRAARTGLPTLTAPITVVQATDRTEQAFLLLLPIYSSDSVLLDQDNRMQATQGWAYSVLIFDEIVDEVSLDTNHLAIHVSDVSNSNQPVVFHQSSNWVVDAPTLTHSEDFERLGRQWRIQAQALPSFYNSVPSQNLWLNGLGVLLLSISLSAVLYFLMLARLRKLDTQRHELELTGSILEASSVGKLVVDQQGNIVRINKRVSELFGYEANELLGQKIDILLPTRFRKSHRVLFESYDGRLRELFSDQGIFGLRRDGSEFRAEITLNSIEVNGEVLFVAGIMDITARLEMIERVKEGESRWRDLANSMAQLVWTMSADGRVNYLSRQWSELLNYSVGQDPHVVFFDCVHAHDKLELQQSIDRAMDFKSSTQSEYRIINRQGKAEWFDMRLVPILDEHGAVVQWIGSNTNIDDRKFAEAKVMHLNLNLEATVNTRTKELLEAKRDLHNILNAVPTMIGYWTNTLENKVANMALASLMDRIPDTNSRDEDSLDWLFNTNNPHLAGALQGEKCRFETTLHLSQSEVLHLDIHYIPNVDDGKVLGLYVLMQDITEVREAQVKAEFHSKQKSTFLAVMSHEIRTPLNGILGYSALLAEKLEEGEAKRDAMMLKKNAETLTTILNDILDVSKVEAGRFKMENIAFNLKDQIDTCCALHSIHAHEKGVNFEVHCEGFDQSSTLLGDPTRLRQVVHNLLSNAIKFTPKGRVSLDVQVKPVARGTVELELAVKDTGVGIPLENQAELFTPFYQGNSSTFRKFGGTGLGLSVVKSIVSAMGGTIGFTSTPGEGSSFRVRVQLPLLDKASLMAVTHADQQPIEPQHMLIVDDMSLNLRVLQKILEHDGHTVEVANSGELAVSACAQTHFDFIFMDISMPGMDGYEATRLIRTGSEHNKDTPIIALSGHAFDDDIEKALDSGMNAHLSKPVEIEKLRARIREFTTR